MEIRIGIVNSARELSFESAQSAEDIEKLVETALAADNGIVRLVDDKGRVFLVPAAVLAYVEVGTEATRRVGFVA